MLPGLTDQARLTDVAGRIVTRLAQPIPFDGQSCQIGVSVGLTISTFYATPHAEGMLHDADRALYAAKRAGCGQVVTHAPTLPNA